MKMTVERVFRATMTIATVMTEKRTLPLRGAYRLARMHAKLLPEFNVIAAKRDDLVRSFGGETVPDEHQAEFWAKWGEIAQEEIEVDVEPIPLSLLEHPPGVMPALDAQDMAALGELVTEQG